MQVTINPGSVSGQIVAPPSKSLTQRAYAGALLHNGKTTIYNGGVSDDELAAFQIIQQLGANIEYCVKQQDQYILGISGSNTLTPTTHTINCGESGLAARLFIPIAALTHKEITITGNGSLLKRPLPEVEKALKQLGVAIKDFNGYLPITIEGKIKPQNIVVEASDSSQLLTGLLFALSSCATEPLTITVDNLQSKPYIDLTLHILEQFGKPIKHNNYKEFYIIPSAFTPPETVVINIEGDWSSAAYFLVAGAIAGAVTVTGLQTDTKQADSAILEILRKIGATIIVENDSITVKQANLSCFDYDATNSPDLFPILAILAACCNGDSSISGVHRLFYKESNRVESITEMLEGFDVPFSIEEDTLYITGVWQLQGTVIESYNDHRIVMAAAIGALRAGSRVDIDNPEAVNKSYPAFFIDLMKCEVDISME